MKEDIAQRRQYQTLGGYENAVDRVISRLDVLIFDQIALPANWYGTVTMFPEHHVKLSELREFRFGMRPVRTLC